jgi:hypothetical protein
MRSPGSMDTLTRLMRTGRGPARESDAPDMVRGWIAQAKAGRLTLPSGTLGHPGDNLYRLTWATSASRKLLLECDEQLPLIITEPGSVVVTRDELRIRACRPVTLDWQEYGNMRPHVDNCGPCEVRVTSGTDRTVA